MASGFMEKRIAKIRYRNKKKVAWFFHFAPFAP
jgi:hypothetical protein